MNVAQERLIDKKKDTSFAHKNMIARMKAREEQKRRAKGTIQAKVSNAIQRTFEDARENALRVLSEAQRMDRTQHNLLVRSKTRQAKEAVVARDPGALKQYKRTMMWHKVKTAAGGVGRVASGAVAGAVTGAVVNHLGGGDHETGRTFAGAGGVIGAGLAAHGAYKAAKWNGPRAHTKAINKAYGSKLDNDWYKKHGPPKVAEVTREDVINVIVEARKERKALPGGGPVIDLKKNSSGSYGKTESVREVFNRHKEQAKAVYKGHYETSKRDVDKAIASGRQKASDHYTAHKGKYVAGAAAVGLAAAGVGIHKLRKRLKARKLRKQYERHLAAQEQAGYNRQRLSSGR